MSNGSRATTPTTKPTASGGSATTRWCRTGSSTRSWCAGNLKQKGRLAAPFELRPERTSVVHVLGAVLDLFRELRNVAAVAAEDRAELFELALRNPGAF